ncbi:MAG: ATP-binding protein [Planctomycetes bacterium]|nr:ATP-binding protein [Planctomycetota bacterium]
MSIKLRSTARKYGLKRPATGNADSATRSAIEMSPEFDRIVRSCQGDELDSRIEALFLRSPAYVQRELSMGRVRAAVYWHCLEGFLAEAGLRRIGHLATTDEATVPIRIDNLELGPREWLEVPRSALVFARGRAGRCVFYFQAAKNDVPLVEVGLHADGDAQPLLSAWELYVRRHHPLRNRVIHPTGEILTFERHYSWDDLYLPAALKADLRSFVEMQFCYPRAVLAHLGIRRRRGAILHGRPGSGKTLIGRILASTLKASFIWATPASLGGEDGIQETLELARLLAPTVLFLEDLDILAEDRATSSMTVGLGELMNQLDGCPGDHEILTIATTNRLEVVEDAIRNRPGRFDRLFEIPPPDRESRSAMLRRRVAGHTVSATDLDWLTRATEDRTGAELEEIVNSALALAFEAAGTRTTAGLRLDRRTLEEALSLCPGDSGATPGFEP